MGFILTLSFELDKTTLVKGFYLPLSLCISLWLIVCSLPYPLFAQNQAINPKKESFWLKPHLFWAYPSVYYSPETRWAMGINALASFKLQKTDSSRKSLAIGFFNYTQNKQFILQQTNQFFTNHEKLNIRTSIHWSRFPEYYFGIGNNTAKQQKELVDYYIFRVEMRTLRRLTSSWFVGLSYRFANQYQVNLLPNGLLDSTQVRGYQGGQVSGLGIMSVYDSRDNVANARRGNYFELTFLPFLQLLGSEYTYQNYRFDARKYVPLRWQKTDYTFVWASQLYANLVLGDSPYKQLSELGGESLMRGYYRGRYRDRHYVAMQTELRLPLIYDQKGIDWVGIVGFVSWGKVFDKKLSPQLGHWAWGTGLRFKFSPKDNLNFRIDYARSPEQGLFYIELAEAF